MSEDRIVEAYYGDEPLGDRLMQAVREAGLGPAGAITPEDLAPLDHFHTGGKAATAALLDELQVERSTRILDIGAGLGGPARLIAHRVGCHVTCVDLTAEFCLAARLFNEMTGLSRLVEVHQGDALALPFPDASFDVVWMQNASMNIEDKPKLYREAQRVLRPGGRIALQEVVAGDAGDPIHYPVPWAEEPSISFLVSEDELRGLLSDAGFRAESWSDVSEWVLGVPRPSPGQPLGLHVYVSDAATKQQNSRRNLQDGRAKLLRVVARAVP